MAVIKSIHTMAFNNNGAGSSAQKKAERQQKRDGQVEYWEGKKEGLKGKKCGSLDAIKERLELLQSYEDGIAAAKATYNREQMFHVLDEARERAEKIAEEAEKYAPKTAEERREEMAEEALGTDENKGELTESLEELADVVEDAAEDLMETEQEILDEADAEEISAKEGEEQSLLLQNEQEAKRKRFNMWV